MVVVFEVTRELFKGLDVDSVKVCRLIDGDHGSIADKFAIVALVFEGAFRSFVWVERFLLIEAERERETEMSGGSTIVIQGC